MFKLIDTGAMITLDKTWPFNLQLFSDLERFLDFWDWEHFLDLKLIEDFERFLD